MKKISNLKLNEEVYTDTIENGLKVYIYPKKSNMSKIMIGTRYGSINTEFVPVNKEKAVKVPDGIAHFLEHKLFEQEDSSALDLFTKLGIDSNAYTSDDRTVYYINCADDIYIGLEKLIEMVNDVYLTEENVEKEKGIIVEELKMINDEPTSSCIQNMLRIMYKNHPVGIDVGGTEESVRSITKENLITCYKTFYNPANMFISVIGDVKPEECLEKIKSYYEKYCKNPNYNVKRIFEDEPIEIDKSEIIKEFPIYNNIMAIGFKLRPVQGVERLKKIAAYQYIDKLYFSNISKFYNDLYDENLISSELELFAGFEDTYSFISYLVEAKDIEMVRQKFINQFNSMKDQPIDDELFELVKKKLYGRAIMSYDNVLDIGDIIEEDFMNKCEIFEELAYIESITKDEIKKIINEDIDISKMCISISKSNNL